MTSVQDIKENYEKELLALKGVAGIGIGRSSPEKIHVYLKSACPSCIEKIPTEIGGVKTETIITGTIRTLAQMPVSPLSVSRTAKYRPCPAGVSISHQSVTAGTFGIVCYDNNTNEPMLLSNNHVLANEHSIQLPGSSIGDDIVQPGIIDGGIVGRDTIAQLARTNELDIMGENEFDCAIAAPISTDDISNIILDIGMISNMGEPQIGDIVRKSGRTTSLTESKIVDVNATIKVDYSRLGELTFKNQTIIYPGFAAGGDSGSVIVRNRDNAAVGLLFAGSETISIANKMIGVADHMNVNLGGGIVPTLTTPAQSELSWIPVTALGLGLSYIYSKVRKVI